MRYSLLGMTGVTALIAVLAAVYRAMGVYALGIVMNSQVPVLLWCVLWALHFDSNDDRLALLRLGLFTCGVALVVAPLVGIVPIVWLLYQAGLIVVFWGVEYLAIVSWTEGS